MQYKAANIAACRRYRFLFAARRFIFGARFLPYNFFRINLFEFFLVEESLYLDGQTEQVDKACGIGLVVAMVLAERCDIFAVKRVRRSYARGNYVAFSWVLSTNASKASLSGVNHCPSYTISPYLMAMSCL